MEKCYFCKQKKVQKMDKQQIQEIVSKYFVNQPVLKAWLFGSFARGAHIEGTADVVDCSTKQVIATIEFECAGESSYGNERRRIYAYEDLAQDLAKLVSKAKNK